MASSNSWRPLKAPEAAMRTFNPIRQFARQAAAIEGPADKPLLNLGIGDPTVFGNLPPPASLEAALCDVIGSKTSNGYTDSTGSLACRTAIASYYSLPTAPLAPADVFVCSGCSGALELALGALASPGQNVLLPAPGFTLYETICSHMGVEVRYYKLRPELAWEVDLAHVRSLCDSNTAAIVVNNPSNPCGSVLREAHLRDIVAVADECHVPIIADEIYAFMAFPTAPPFVPLASLSPMVPVLTVSGLAKRYMVPGWRVGWLTVHDPCMLLPQVREALFNLSTIILGANLPMQTVVINALQNTPESYYADSLSQLSEHARILTDALSTVPALMVVEPQGAMYMMVGVRSELLDSVGESDVAFALALKAEENVNVLPGSIFHFPMFFRIVVCAPAPRLTEACARIAAFCARHRKQ